MIGTYSHNIDGYLTFGRSLAIFATGIGLVIVPCQARAADPTASVLPISISNVESLLNANDVAAAAQLGKQIPEPAHRDRALQMVANAQLASNAFRDAVTTAAYIDDDTTRDQQLRRMAEQAVKTQTGSAGGGSQADFDTLIELIQSTVEPPSWEEAGGTGTAAGFPGGVLVDTTGVLTRTEPIAAERRPSSPANPKQWTTHVKVGSDFRQSEMPERDSQLSTKARKISLRRLERQLQLLTALGQPADQVMRNLGGLYRVEQIIVINQGTIDADIVLVGPAGECVIDDEQRWVNVETGWPVLQLDDLVVLLRNAFDGGGVFGCSITPRPAHLARAQQYLNETSSKPLKPRQRDAWLDGLRQQLGEQDITVHGVHPGSHVARVIVEADYRMKLVGMGIEPGVAGVTSYLDRVEIEPDGTVTPMTVLRWWFALTAENITTNAGRDTFVLPKHSVRVLSENELLTQTGQRVHTGTADELNKAFAEDFTTHFAELATTYPIYAELQNVFDLALVAGVIKSEDLPARIGWQMTYFVPSQQGGWLGHRPPLREAPRTVETVLSHRVLQQKHIVAGVSGGVLFQTNKRHSHAADSLELSNEIASSYPADWTAWWWD